MKFAIARAIPQLAAVLPVMAGSARAQEEEKVLNIYNWGSSFDFSGIEHRRA